jgi:4-amino-4-deoxy-L-arabinose transferase-like glycosyltransferase
MQIQASTYSFRLFKRNHVISLWTLLLVVVIAATGLRLLSAVYQGNTVKDLPGINDQISYDGLARRVVNGFGFSFAEDHWPATRAGEPTAHWSYLYTLYLVAIYKVFGFIPLIARLIQALIVGVLQPLLTWRIGSRLFNRTVGLIAAALSAVYIYFFYYAGALITESFYIVCILWTFDSAFRLVGYNRVPQAGKQRQKWGAWLEFGLAIGMTVLLRQLFLLFLPFLFVWIWWNSRDEEKELPRKRSLHWPAVKGLFIATLVLFMMILPFTIRNYRAFGTFELLNTNAGFAFYWGNHPIHGTHFIPLLPNYRDLIPPSLLPLNEAMLDKALLGEGIKIVINDPIRFVLLSFSRVEEFIKFWPSPDSGLISNVSRVGSFGILLPFMLYGLWISFSKMRKPDHPGQPADLLLIYLFIVIYTLIHLLSWTLIRYRLPIDAFLILFAALAFEKLILRFWPNLMSNN